MSEDRSSVAAPSEAPPGQAAWPHEMEALPPRRRGRPWLRILLAVVLAGLLVAGLGAVWLARQINPPGGPGAEVEITIPEGSSGAAIGRLLERAGVVTNATVFRLYAEYEGGGPLRAGTYRLRRHDHLHHLLGILEAGQVAPPDRITIPEGFTLAQIAARVGTLQGRSAARFLAVASSGAVRSSFEPAGSTNLEGLLFPDTYYVTDKDDEATILRRMVEAFDQQATEAGVATLAVGLKVTPYQAIIVASMIEREARVDQDRAKIARVIYNRLARGLPLQVDATVQYALPQPKLRLTDADLRTLSPYNTYLIKGLPPTPIASPGRLSIEAALVPTPGPWLYYVLAGADGHHAFAVTDAEFQRLKAAAHRAGLL